jgi:thiamine pyrophosphokinase
MRGDNAGPATDPSNLLRVIPAEGGTMNGTASVSVAIVFAGNRPVAPSLREWLPDDADVVAADSGLRVAEALGMHVNHLVGDLDSADPDEVEAAVASGTTVDRHPAEKDATDLALALDAAVARGAQRIVVVDGGGDRLDHLLGNLLLLASPALAGVEVEAFCGTARILLARGGDPPVTIGGALGSFVTLLPVGGPAYGINTRGLRYRLADEDLWPGTTRGISNELAAHTASVWLEAGALLVVQPFAGALPADVQPGGVR